MNKFLIHIYIFLIMFSTSCKKDILLQEDNTNLLKIVQLETPYLARSVIELEDGSIVLISISDVSSALTANPTTDYAPVITKFDQNGNLLWQHELPEIIQTVWHIIELSDGNFAVSGFDKNVDSKFLGLVILNSSGEIIKQTTLFNAINLINIGAGIVNKLDMIQLSNSNIAITLNSTQSIAPSSPRLVVFDLNLNLLFDKTYAPSTIVQTGFCHQIYLHENNAGDLLLHGRLTRNNTKIFAFDLKLSANTYEPIYHQVFNDTVNSSSSSFALSNTNDLIWVSTIKSKVDTQFTSWFNLRFQEYHKVGNKLKVWKSNENQVQDNINEITGFPKNAYISKVKKTNDGGFILLGTCNINNNQDIPSDYRLIIIKLNSLLATEWIEYPNAIYATVASDIVETKHGYLISATQFTFAEESRPVILKLNKLGVIN